MNLTRHRKAFTFIELVIVIGVIVVLAGMVTGISSGFFIDRAIYNEATKIQQDILMVQNLAITHASGSINRFEIRFYPSLNKYVIEASEDANLTSGTGKLITRQLGSTVGFPEYFGKSVPDSIAFGASSTPPNAYVDLSFNNMGSPYQGAGHINLITSSGRQIQVIVSVIGRVRVDWIQR
jgi:prepilin-type N-terminal cleavage/methylation domain-containing protein